MRDVTIKFRVSHYVKRQGGKKCFYGLLLRLFRSRQPSASQPSELPNEFVLALENIFTGKNAVKKGNDASKNIYIGFKSNLRIS